MKTSDEMLQEAWEDVKYPKQFWVRDSQLHGWRNETTGEMMSDVDVKKAQLRRLGLISPPYLDENGAWKRRRL